VSFFERLKSEASAEWRAYTEHPFTNGLGDGSLAEAAFRHYLVQDYLFLIEFARAYALSVYKSPKLADKREAAAGLAAILDVEMNLHVKLCAGWGLSPSDLEQTPPASETLAYTRYVLDAGMRGDLLALKVALASCVIGYAEIATRLASLPDADAAPNPYRVWIDEYAGVPYQGVAAKARAHLEHLADLYATPAGGRADCGLQGSHPTRGRLLGDGLARGPTLALILLARLICEVPSRLLPFWRSIIQNLGE
jgi:thiaminase (transcriptional activator TenA)